MHDAHVKDAARYVQRVTCDEHVFARRMYFLTRRVSA